jgi:catechol 2,3-dioxygenase-like lactoylglutathione lyase family enzyme
MMGRMIRSVFPVVCSPDLDGSRDFYRDVLGLDVAFECGWYTLLVSRTDPDDQLGFVALGHESVPAPYGDPAAGVLVTVEVDDADAIYERAGALGAECVLPIRDEIFGQRHFMLRDPNGLLLDVVQRIRPSASFLRDVARRRREGR